jgi:hypothetical protein
MMPPQGAMTNRYPVVGRGHGGCPSTAIRFRAGRRSRSLRLLTVGDVIVQGAVSVRLGELQGRIPRPPDVAVGRSQALALAQRLRAAGRRTAREFVWERVLRTTLLPMVVPGRAVSRSDAPDAVRGSERDLTSVA